MNDKVKSAVGFLRGLAVDLGIQSVYVGADQAVRSLVNEHIKKNQYGNKNNNSK